MNMPQTETMLKINYHKMEALRNELELAKSKVVHIRYDFYQAEEDYQKSKEEYEAKKNQSLARFAGISAKEYEKPTVSFDNDKAYQIEFKNEYAKRQFFWGIHGMIGEQDVISEDTIMDAMELYEDIEYNGGDTGESLNLTKKQFDRDYPGLWESFAQYLIIK